MQPQHRRCMTEVKIKEQEEPVTPVKPTVKIKEKDPITAVKTEVKIKEMDPVILLTPVKSAARKVIKEEVPSSEDDLIREEIVVEVKREKVVSSNDEAKALKVQISPIKVKRDEMVSDDDEA